MQWWCCMLQEDHFCVCFFQFFSFSASCPGCFFVLIHVQATKSKNTAYFFFVFRFFWNFFCECELKIRNKCLASSYILTSFHCHSALFLVVKIQKLSGTWQIGTTMTENGKMKLDICSHFWTHTRTLKNLEKKRKTKKQYYFALLL